MSAVAAMDQAYDRFLATSDLDAWTASLDAHGELFSATADLDSARPVDVRRALTLSVYVAWLAVRCGDQALRDRVAREMDALSARLAARPPRDGIEGVMIRAVIAAGKGYQAAARQLVAGLGAPLPVELALLTTPQRAVTKAEWLKPYATGAGPHFVPAVYYYGSALLDLGYPSSARELLDRHPSASASAMMIDLRGQLFELAGSWSEARDQYARSAWVSHAYRRAVCELIVGAPIERLVSSAPEAIARFTEGMLEFDSETDRAGVLRSASFIRACRWNGFDNWLVHFELGRVSFQRRRHAEAERHLAAAVNTAPAAFRFPIRDLRFINLGWLGEAMDVDTEPEAIEEGEAALREPATDAQYVRIRLWIGGRADATSAVLDPVLASGSDYMRGEVHKRRGNIPDAIAAWCREIAINSTSRAMLQLIRTLASYGFEQAASSLARTAALESEDNFFELWELADAIAGSIAAHAPEQISGKQLGVVLAKAERRMEALVEAEFQHALRACHYFVERRLPEPAQRMLARVAALAEGPEELLLLAIARRKVGAGPGDPVALETLRAAQRQSTDRLERLLIARELVHFGDRASARRILTEEGVFAGARDLTAIEHLLVLTCAAGCAGEDDRERFEDSAIAALKADLAAGRFATSGARCRDRLNACLDVERFEMPFAQAADRSDVETCEFGELVAQLERFEAARRSEREMRMLNERVEALSAQGSPAAQLALWGVHLERFDAQVAAIDRLRPTVADDELPLARDLSPLRTRARLAALWRAQLQAEPDDAAHLLEDIRRLRASDRALAVRWDRLRSAEAAVPSRYALGYARQGAVLLGRIASGADSATLWPAFLDVWQAATADAKSLASRLEERVAALHERVAR